MAKKKEIKHQIELTVKQVHELYEQVRQSYENAGVDDIYPENDYEGDTALLTTVDGNLFVNVTIKCVTSYDKELSI